MNRSTAINWYRIPVEKDILKILHKKDSLRGLLHSLAHIALVAFCGYMAAIFFINNQWGYFVTAFWAQGTFGTFLGAAQHELGHGTVFKQKALNRFFLNLFSLFTWWNHHHYSMSHTFHHKYTLHPPKDKEVLLPLEPSLKPALLIQLFTFNILGLIGKLKNTIYTALGLWFDGPLGGANPEGANPWIKELSIVYPKKYRLSQRFARTILIFHASVLIYSILTSTWWLPFVLSLWPFTGNWLSYFVGSTQHTGLIDNTADFRLNTRSVKLHPFIEFLYWHMNWHAEHHMYAGVPGYNLKRLNEIISNDMPEPKTLIRAWLEMRDTFKKQNQNPNYQYHQKIPNESSSKKTNTDHLEKYTESIGLLAPEEQINQDGLNQVFKSKFDSTREWR
tara:strand:+ start:75 stop:1247 length:1173 start_codon:yes stop_codon:yes gene_type:complete